MALASASESVMTALSEAKDHMASELLADDIVLSGEIDSDLTKTVSIGDDEITISVKKA